MTPGYALDIPALQAAIAPWLPGNPERDAFVRPNQETAQVYLQLKNHGFECHITPLCVRPEKISGDEGRFTLLVYMEHDGKQFDARDTQPCELVESYCKKRDIGLSIGDIMEQTIGQQVMNTLVFNADKAPNPGLYRAIEAAIAQMQRDRIDADTQRAERSGKKGGRL